MTFSANYISSIVCSILFTMNARTLSLITRSSLLAETQLMAGYNKSEVYLFYYRSIAENIRDIIPYTLEYYDSMFILKKI